MEDRSVIEAELAEITNNITQIIINNKE